MSLQSIVFDKEEGKLSILNQLLLPDITLYEEVNTVQDAWDAIKNMKVGSYFLAFFNYDYHDNMLIISLLHELHPYVQ